MYVPERLSARLVGDENQAPAAASCYRMRGPGGRRSS